MYCFRCFHVIFGLRHGLPGGRFVCRLGFSAATKVLSIVTAINALDADCLGLIGLRLLFIAAQAAVQCLQREDLDGSSDCLTLLETFKARGFHFLLEVLLIQHKFVNNHY